MSLYMLRPKRDTEDLLLSKTENCQTLIEQTKTRPQETMEFKMTKPRETFHFNLPVEVKENWIWDLEFYNSIFNITEESNKFEFYKFSDKKTGGISYTRVRDEIGRNLGFSDIAATDLQDDIIAPIIFDEYKEQVIKRMEHEQFMNILSIYTSSVFQGFKSFLRTQIYLVEDDIKLVLDEHNSSFFTYKITPGFYTFKDISRLFLTFFKLNIQDLVT